FPTGPILSRKAGWLLALEDAIDVASFLPKLIGPSTTVRKVKSTPQHGGRAHECHHPIARWAGPVQKILGINALSEARDSTFSTCWCAEMRQFVRALRFDAFGGAHERPMKRAEAQKIGICS